VPERRQSRTQWDGGRLHTAVATGQEPTLDPYLVDACWQIVESQADLLRTSGMYRKDVAGPPGSGMDARLLGALGRKA
jgi:hypothetical protein